jgi:hypothetical protein
MQSILSRVEFEGMDTSQMRVWPNPFARWVWIIWGLMFWSIMPDYALADNVRPVYLEIEELQSGNIRVVWKVPRGQGLPADFRPSFPKEFRVIPPQKRVQTNDAVIETWNMIGGSGGLAGAQIRIDGLKQTTTDALVRVRLSEGAVHRVVLRPSETSTTIPNPRNSMDEQKNTHILIRQFIDYWPYGLLLSIALVLSLLPLSRRRGIILCTAALVAGSFCGHAIGRLPVHDTLFEKSIPSKKETAKILQGLLLNTYRAFMLQEDEDIYDILSLSVSGEFLSEVYLQNRENMRMSDSDGTMAIIHQLDIKSIHSVVQEKDGHLAIAANWDVYGSVHHQNHVHYRCNTYKAQVTIGRTDNYWKLVKIQLLDEQRVL